MADGFVQTPADNTGKRVDAEQVTNNDGVTVFRLRMDVPGKVRTTGDLLELLLLEKQRTNRLLAQALGIDDEIEEPEGD